MSEYFVDTSSLAGIQAASNRTPTAPGSSAPRRPDGSRRGDAATATTPSGSGASSTGTAPSRQPTRNTVGVLFPRPYSDVYVNTSSLQGILNASNYNSPTWVGQYTAGTPGKPGTLPRYGSSQVQDYDWLFGIIAKDYYSTSTAKKWYEEQFLEQALNVSRTEGRMVNVVDLAYEYAVDKGLLDDQGQLTSRGEDAYRIYLGEKGGGGSSGGGGYSYSGYSGGGGYGGGGGGGTSSVALTDPTSARGLLMQTMQSVLGRDPSRGEVRQFLKILNESEMSNPRTVEMDGDVAVQSGGIDPGVLALDFAQDAEDFEEVRGDEFFQTFMRALAGV